MLLTRIFCHFETWPKCIGMSFFVYDPWTTELLEMNENIWNLCFHMIVWCFNPINTIHVFLWEKIAHFGCGVMASLWVQTTSFGVCLWQSLNNLPGHLSYTQRQRMTIENLILNDPVHTLFSGNKTMSKLYCQRWKCCFPVYWNCLKKSFACKLNCLKQCLI